MLFFAVPQHWNGVDFMFSHSRILILFLFIVILILTVIGFIFQRFILCKVWNEVTVLTVCGRTVIIIIILLVMVSSPSVRPEDECGGVLVVCWCCNIHINYVTKVTEDIVQEIKMLTKFDEKLTSWLRIVHSMCLIWNSAYPVEFFDCFPVLVVDVDLYLFVCSDWGFIFFSVLFFCCPNLSDSIVVGEFWLDFEYFVFVRSESSFFDLWFEVQGDFELCSFFKDRFWSSPWDY